jgi:hypothetical protein
MSDLHCTECLDTGIIHRDIILEYPYEYKRARVGNYIGVRMGCLWPRRCECIDNGNLTDTSKIDEVQYGELPGKQ